MRHLRTLLIVLVTLLAASGCTNDIVTQPALPATLARLWPHPDSRAWTYRLIQTTWPVVADSSYIYPEVDSVPAAPGFPGILALIHADSIGAGAASDTATYRLEFDGVVEIAPGDTAQVLVPSFLPVGVAPIPDFPELLRESRMFGLSSSGAPRTGVALTVGPPILLPGGNWKNTGESIGLYASGGQVLWKYLTSSLATGSEFSLPLVPALSGDPVLRGYVYGTVTVSTPAGVYVGAVMCLYIVDFGVTAVTDDSGALVGYQRQFHWGWVAYDVDVGPVAGYERHLALAGSPPSRGVGLERFALSIAPR